MDLFKELKELHERGYVRMSKHPKFPLYVWNYTPAAQYTEGAFETHPILNKARGLVTDDKGNIIAKAFTRFLNFEQHHPDEIPKNGECVITPKMDGSLILVFKIKVDGKEEVIFASRGSFTSRWANEARELFYEKYSDNDLQYGVTYLFEYISPRNRIVVAYNEPKIILIGANNTLTGKEIDIRSIPKFEKVKIFDTKNGINNDDFVNLKALNKKNEEGYVAHHPESGFRTKIKFLDYIQQHGKVTETNSHTIWEYLSEGKNINELIEGVPDEFFQYVKKTVENLQDKHDKIELEVKLIAQEFKHIDSQKERAQKILAKYPKQAHMIFNVLSGKEISGIIWKLIEPKHDKTFFSEGMAGNDHNKN